MKKPFYNPFPYRPSKEFIAKLKRETKNIKVIPKRLIDINMTTRYNTAMPKTADKITLQPGHIKAFRFIEKYIAKNVMAPEMEEISKGIKITIRHTYRIVDDLCVLGYLERAKYRRRSLTILKPLQ